MVVKLLFRWTKSIVKSILAEGMHSDFQPVDGVSPWHQTACGCYCPLTSHLLKSILSGIISACMHLSISIRETDD